MSKLEVDTARQLSRVRIHVERVIGLLWQKYTILESSLPINFIMCNEQADYSILLQFVRFVIFVTLFINSIDACMYAPGHIILCEI